MIDLSLFIGLIAAVIQAVTAAYQLAVTCKLEPLEDRQRAAPTRRAELEPRFQGPTLHAIAG